jgi:S-adenosylmethionine uptake transporter
LLINTPLQPLNAQNSFFIILAAFFIIFGYYSAVLVMRSGEISFISPFRYSAILFALILGFIFFNEQPDKIAILGIVIVMLSGVILMMRNSSVQKQSARSKVKT